MTYRSISRGGRLLAALFALALIVAACGDDSDPQAGSSTTTVSEHDDDHTGLVDVSDLDPTPTVTAEVTEDPMSGWNLHLDLEGHEMAPESASTEHVPGQGHAHLYIDGEKVNRLYEADYFLGDLDPGEHEVMVELSANDHGPLGVDGVAVADTVMVDVPEADATEHTHGEVEPVDASAFEPVPSVDLEVLEDPKSGWNLHATFEGHQMAPEAVSTDAVEGEGHAHIYVDGEKLTRLYGEWYHLGDLAPGEREIRVELSANDHSPLAVSGDVVDDTVTIEVTDSGEDGHGDEDHAEEGHDDADAGDPVDATAAAEVIELAVLDGTATGDTGRREVGVGDVVLVRVTSDTADEVHVHGYDHIAEVGPDQPAEIQFVADIPGVFEIELEGTGLLLAELAVS